MLILTRKRGEEIFIKVPKGLAVDEDIRVVLLETFSSGTVRIGIDANPCINITRDNAVLKTPRVRRETLSLPKEGDTDGDQETTDEG